MKNSYRIWLISLWVALAPLSLLAHGDEHNDSTKQETAETVLSSPKTGPAEQNEDDGTAAVFKSYEEFPNLHPMVVHFPRELSGAA